MLDIIITPWENYVKRQCLHQIQSVALVEITNEKQKFKKCKFSNYLKTIYLIIKLIFITWETERE